ncbi:MAG: hemolysin family protein [Anaerolineaceae bacterium]|nr:hemolysin family protein [Anaerolineaceae bacterium]
MINTLWFLLVLFLVLDLVFMVVRASLVNARLPGLLELHEQNPAGVDRTMELLERPKLRPAIRLAVLVIHFLLVGAGWLLFVDLLGYQPGIGLTLITLALSALVMLLIEFSLEGLVLRNPEIWAIRMTPFGRLIDFFFRPFSWILLPLLGSPLVLKNILGSVTEDELKTWVEADHTDGSLEKGERKMIYSIFQFGDTLTREIMIPRMDVLALEVSTSPHDAIQGITLSGHSRVPVYEGTIDNVIGLLYAKDMLRAKLGDDASLSIRKMLRPAYFVPEAKKVDELLSEMRSRRVHMAIVIDEYGGMAGVVTLEDIVEEIFGEIRDEYDQGEELLYQQVGPDEYIFQGRIDLEDFNEIVGTHLTREVADTLGGFIYGEIGRVPVGGEAVEVEGWILTVETVSARRIRKIRVQRKPGQSEAEEKEDESERRSA